MKLFGALFRRKYLPNGNIWRGKDRLTRPITYKELQKTMNFLEIEERNMFLLRHPYLTPEQSLGHAKALGKHEAYMLKHISRQRPVKPNITIAAELGHLRVKESWD